jgi:hypothetical protein
MPRFLSCAFQLAATSLKAVAEQIAHCRSSERKKSPPVRLRHARQLAAACQNQEEADRTILYSLAHLVGGRSAPFHQTSRYSPVRQIGAEPLSKCIATVQDHALSCPLVILALHSKSGPRSIGGGGRGRAGVAANRTLVPSQLTIQQLPDAPIQWGDHCLLGHCKS